MNSSKKIGIVGAGIAGLTCAIMLRNLGYEVEIFESAEKVRGIGAGIGLASNAMKGFEYLGLAEKVKGISNYLQDFEIVDWKGKSILKTDTQRISQNYQIDNYVVHRADLHRLLVNEIPSEILMTGKKLISIRELIQRVEIQFEDGRTQEYDYIIAADGVNSTVRQNFLPKSSPRYAGYWCWRSVVQIPNLQLNKGTEVWGLKGRFGISPLTQNRIYWYACLNSNLRDGVPEFQLENLKKRFQDYFPFVGELLDLSRNEDIISTPIVDIAPIDFYHFRRVLILGDAAHATTPNMGQGACMAIEDVAVLKEELSQNDWEISCRNFEKRRLKRTHYIIKNSELAGKIAQLENPFLGEIRNFIFRKLPSSIVQAPLKGLLEEDFMKI